MSKNHLLIEKFLNNTITPSERQVLEKWVLESEENKKHFKSYVSHLDHTNSQDFDWDIAYSKFLTNNKPNKKTSKTLLNLFKYAALIIILVSIGFYSKSKITEKLTTTPNNVVTTDLIKGKNIVIKLADGSLKVIKPHENEIITDKQQNYIAKKTDGLLSFDTGNETANTKEVFNEIYVPYGEIFKIKLSDGTTVSLNAGSKLKFPQQFIDSKDNRMVYLEGEAYFDVSKNKNKPFIVNTNAINVKVYGTQFNVSSYEKDHFVETTLIEGAVSVYKTDALENEIFIKPNFQAYYNKTENNFSKKEVDTDIYTAWMQNRFVINNITFSKILVKLERRYNVKFDNKAQNINKETFKGEFDKENIQSILTTMALSHPFNFKINGNVITITE